MLEEVTRDVTDPKRPVRSPVVVPEAEWYRLGLPVSLCPSFHCCLPRLRVRTDEAPSEDGVERSDRLSRILLHHGVEDHDGFASPGELPERHGTWHAAL